MPDALAEHLAELLVAVLAPLIAWALAQARRWHINTTVVRALARGAGAAYMALLEEKRGTEPAAVERALDAGAAYVEQRVPSALISAGFGSTDAVRQAVRAQLGTLLAADPNVKVGGA